MNGVPNSPAHRYLQVKDTEVSFNTWVDCELPWQLGVGSDEERSLAPESSTICNNLLYCPQEELLIKAFDKLDGITFKDNLLYSARGNEIGEGFVQGEARLGRGVAGLPLAITKMVSSTDMAYVTVDIDGRKRGAEKWIGAIEMNGNDAATEQASRGNCGPHWYTPAADAPLSEKVVQVSPGKDALLNAIRKSGKGDILELQEGLYTNSRKMTIPHTLTIRADKDAKTRPVVKVDAETASTISVFEIGSDLTFTLDGIAIDGGAKQKVPAKYAFATVKESSHFYNVHINNCEVYDFKDTNGGCIYKAYKNSFAETLRVTNSIFRDSYRGFALNDEKDAKGLYSAEFMIFDNTVFQNIEQWAIDFLRGGNDESTLGGNLQINHCIFDNVYDKENQSMIRQTGLITLNIENSVFCNSDAKHPVKLAGRYNTISYSTIYNAGKVQVSGGAVVGEGMMYSNPFFEKKSFYKLSDKSPLVGKANDGSNIGLR